MKSVRYKPYDTLQSLSIPIHQWKDLFVDFVIGLPVFPNWISKTYDSILVIVNRLTKMVHYEPVKVTINASALVEVIIKMVVQDHGVLDPIVSNRLPQNFGLYFTTS